MSDEDPKSSSGSEMHSCAKANEDLLGVVQPMIVDQQQSHSQYDTTSTRVENGKCHAFQSRIVLRDKICVSHV